MTNCIDCKYANFEYNHDGYTPLVVFTPLVIWSGIAGNWDDFFGWLAGEIFFYVITLFSNVLHDMT